ncbi:20483_t:CDS:2 [Cetraspora pellucida]|uniref:20483_t:CDS:1 n=1 Tax=Cetraspora pellucida TaxID=1433469 RepID=A0A9N9FNS9_9GLOM|nr:20483_t:CDS:2 [Cetraspora pellucida]
MVANNEIDASNTIKNSKTNEINTSNAADDSETNKYNGIDDSKINVVDYYEEAYRGSIDIVDVEDVNMDAEVITLKEEKSFFNFDDAEQQIRGYAEFKEFKTKLGWSTMIKTENGKIMRKRTILCHYSGRYQSKNSTKSGKSIKLECPWHVNLSQPSKQNLNNYVYITTLNDEYNHEMCPEALQFERDKVFTKEMRDDVEFYVRQCHFGATLIRRILKQKYSFHPVFSKNLYKEIQKYKPTAQFNQGDAARFYEELLTKQCQDPCWFVEFSESIGHDNTSGTNCYCMPLSLFVARDDNMKSQIVAQALLSDETTESYQWTLRMLKKATREKMPGVIITDGDPAMERAVLIECSTTRHLFCIWHIKENLKKMLRGKLGAEFDDFYSAFWKCRNSDTPESFDYYWNEMISKYPLVKQYLERYLYERRKSWARGFTATLFTLGIESTSFVESQNACIKRVLESSNTSLCELGKILIDQAENRINQKKYKNLVRDVPLTTKYITIFPLIEAIVSCYLCQNVAQHIINQMKKCVYYTAYHSSIEEVENTLADEPSESESFEDEPDSVLVCAQFLLNQLDKANIEEVWKISQIIGRNINHMIFCLFDGSYSCTCLLRQKLGLVCRHYFHLLNVTRVARFSMKLINIRWISRKYLNNALNERDYYGQRKEDINDDLVKEQLFYRKVWGLIRTATNKCLLHRDHGFIQLIENYLDDVHKREEELAKIHQADVSDDSDEENTCLTVQLKNPLVVNTKGRPKSASYNKNNTNQQLVHKGKRKRDRGLNLCSYCKELGHNIATCSKRVTDKKD